MRVLCSHYCTDIFIILGVLEMKKISLTTILATMLLLNGCNSVVDSGDGNKANRGTVANSSSSVYFDSFGTIPLVSGVSDYIIRLHNDGEEDYKIVSAHLTPVVEDGTTGATLDTNNCEKLSRHSQCGFILKYPANNTSSYILSAEVENSLHNRETIQASLISDQSQGSGTVVNFS